jgi:hypothetical protein
MLETAFAILLKVAAIYAGCGLLLAVLFLVLWCRSFDPSAASGTWGFRLLIVPGLVALWPLMLAKVLAVRRGGTAQGPAEQPVQAGTLRRNHGIAFVVLAILCPLIFAVALIWRAPEIPRSGGVPPPLSQNTGRDGPTP